jgi:hypothetical protein
MGRRAFRVTRLLCGLACAWLAAAAALPEAHGIETTVGGVRIGIGGYLEGLGVVPVDPDTRRQRPELTLRLTSAAEPVRNLRLVLSVTGLAGGTPVDARPGVFDLERAIQNRSPSLEVEELYADWHASAFDVRAGKQKFAWGKLDVIQPNDWLNPEKYYDPLLTGEDERKIGVPAIAVSWSPSLAPRVDDFRVTAVWVPIHVPFRFPQKRERWFPPLAIPPRTFRDEGRIPLGLAVENRNEGPRGLDDGNVALRVSGLLADVDWALYYFDGFDPLPLFNVHAREAGPELEVVETPAFRRFRAGGADLAWAVAGLSLRAEVSYQERRPFSRNIKRDLSGHGNVPDDVFAFLRDFSAGEVTPAFVERDAIMWGIGADYPVAGFMPVAEVVQTRVLRNDRRLLIEDVETQLIGIVRKRWLDDRLETRAVVIYGVEGRYFAVIPRVSYALRDDLAVAAGLLAVGGSRQSLLGQFAENDEGFVTIRYTF